MRRAITRILYVALVIAGLYLNLWLYQTQTGARFSVLVVGCFLILFGGYVLWTFFVSEPRERIKKCRGLANHAIMGTKKRRQER
jgi:hypothetical protein